MPEFMFTEELSVCEACKPGWPCKPVSHLYTMRQVNEHQKS
jgi:hypothetical protein